MRSKGVGAGSRGRRIPTAIIVEFLATTPVTVTARGKRGADQRAVETERVAVLAGTAEATVELDRPGAQVTRTRSAISAGSKAMSKLTAEFLKLKQRSLGTGPTTVRVEADKVTREEVTTEESMSSKKRMMSQRWS